MKPFLTATLLLCLVIAAAMIHTSSKPAAPASLTEAASPAEVAPAPVPVTPPAIINPPVPPHRHPLLAAAAHHPGAPSGNPATDAIPESVKLLVSPTATFQQREAVWQQLNDLDHLDPVIEALK